MWIADAHRGDGKRFVVRADEKLTAFLEVELALVLAASIIKEMWSRLAACKARSYMKIRLGLNRRTLTTVLWLTC